MATRSGPGSLAIPTRSSSINTFSERPLYQKGSRDDLRYIREFRAQKVLGSFSAENTEGSSLGTLEPKQSAEDFHDGEQALVSELDMRFPSSKLRVRASSPLLGRGYRTGKPFASSQPKVTDIRKSGSWSDARFFQDPEKASTGSQTGHAPSAVGPQKESIGSGTRLGGEEPDKDPRQKPQRKGSRWRLRPTRIDLSLLFPKPRAPSAPLLSPHRLTHSPSPVPSATSDYSLSIPSTNKLTKRAPSRSRSTSPKRLEESPKNDAVPPISRERRPVDGFDVPVEGSDVVQLDNLDSPQQASFPPQGIRFRGLTCPSTDCLQSRGGDSGISDKTIGKTSSSSFHPRSIDTQFSPKPMSPLSDTVQNPLDTWQAGNGPNRRSVRRPVPQKRCKYNLANYDLTKYSILSLSSSEDEGEYEDEEIEAMKSDRAVKSVLRDSIGTLDEAEPEICTAEAVLATKGSALTHLEKPDAFRRKSRQWPRSLSRARSSLTSSPVKPSQSETTGQPPNSKKGFDPASFERRATPRQSVSASQLNYKRRLVAVTQQEESFIEAMRRRNGTITPSLFSEIREKTCEPGPVPILPSLPSDPTRDSDKSFLRLSSVIPSPQHLREESDGFVVTASDVDLRGDNSSTSPQVSLIFSDSHSSASVGQVSPLTPTLPIHRFSTPSSPPPFAPPSVPDNQKLHSRRRTDSSGVLGPGREEDTKDDDEFPIWAVQWTQDAAHIAMVH